MGYPFPMQGDLPNPGIEPMSLVSPALAGGFFTPGSPGKPKKRKKQVRKGETLVQRNRYKLFVLGSFMIPLLPTSVALSATRPTNTHPSSALTTDLYLIDYIKFLIFRTFFYIPSAWTTLSAPSAITFLSVSPLSSPPCAHPFLFCASSCLPWALSALYCLPHSTRHPVLDPCISLSGSSTRPGILKDKEYAFHSSFPRACETVSYITNSW